MDNIVITKEIMLAANDYISLEAKEEWVAENAPKCFNRLAITADGEDMPPMYMINTALRSRYLMTVLARNYFNQEIEVEDDDNALMTVVEYDRWAGSHVFGQIDRLKHDVEARDRCYDLLADYRDLEKRFSSHMNALLMVQNDAVIRQNDYMATQMRRLPETIQALRELQEGNTDAEQPA